MAKFSQSTVLRQFHAHTVVIVQESDKLGKSVACQYPGRQDTFNLEAFIGDDSKCSLMMLKEWEINGKYPGL